MSMPPGKARQAHEVGVEHRPLGRHHFAGKPALVISGRHAVSRQESEFPQLNRFWLTFRLASAIAARN
jgi:hypothetical protein